MIGESAYTKHMQRVDNTLQVCNICRVILTGCAPHILVLHLPKAMLGADTAAVLSRVLVQEWLQHCLQLDVWVFAVQQDAFPSRIMGLQLLANGCRRACQLGWDA